MDRADFEQLKEYLKENLTIEVGYSWDERTVELWLDGEKISQADLPRPRLRYDD